jgi:alcohol dehydrogenase (cytochrome c)
LWSHSFLTAIDYKTGKSRWQHDMGEGEDSAGILSTAGNILFTADNNDNLLALDSATGKTLWHTSVGGSMQASPMTYELDGRQYVLTPIQNVILAWALPEAAK